MDPAQRRRGASELSERLCSDRRFPAQAPLRNCELWGQYLVDVFDVDFELVNITDCRVETVLQI